MSGITNPTEQYFKDGVWGWDETAWRKLAMLWGYSDRWAENLGGTKSGAGTYLASTVAVPAGWVYVAQFAFFRNITGVRGNAGIYFYDTVTAYWSCYVVAPVAWIPLLWNGAVPLCAGDSLRVTQSTCLDGDVIQAGVWGYKMRVS